MQSYKNYEELGKHEPTKVIQQTANNCSPKMEIQKLHDKVFKIIVLKMLRELQENIDK